MLIGYARCSTDAQDFTAQRDALTALGVQPGRARDLVREGRLARARRAADDDQRGAGGAISHSFGTCLTLTLD